MFGLAAHFAELSQNLKDVASPDTIDTLNHAFGNFRAARQNPALIAPTLNVHCQLLDDLGESHPHLNAKCLDLRSTLYRFLPEEVLPF